MRSLVLFENAMLGNCYNTRRRVGKNRRSALGIENVGLAEPGCGLGEGEDVADQSKDYNAPLGRRVLLVVPLGWRGGNSQLYNKKN